MMTINFHAVCKMSGLTATLLIASPVRTEASPYYSQSFSQHAWGNTAPTEELFGSYHQGSWMASPNQRNTGSGSSAPMPSSLSADMANIHGCKYDPNDARLPDPDDCPNTPSSKPTIVYDPNCARLDGCN